MAVDQERGSRGKARMHCEGFTSIEADQDEALPSGAVGLGFRPDAVKEGLFKFKDVFYVRADDERLGGDDRAIGEEDIFEFAGARRKDRGSFVDFGWVEEIKNRKVLNLEDLVHAFEAESSLTVEEVRDMSLLETGLLGETKAG